VAAEERSVTVGFAGRLRDLGVEVRGVSVGSTPTMSVVEDLAGVSEMRPGNYVFYDLTQLHLGSCTLADCALSVLSSVVSCQPRARHSVIDAGALALSRDPGPAWLTPPSMGRLFDGLSTSRLRQDCRVVSLSQEHGIVDAPLPVGSRLRIAPNHSCLTVAQFDAYHVVRGDEVIDQWRIWRAR
jgi:D-serine deaminase-like pyridoxal phosphate-dependent protein